MPSSEIATYGPFSSWWGGKGTCRVWHSRPQSDWNRRWISLLWWYRGLGKQLSCRQLYLCSPGTKQRTSGFLSNTYLIVNPIQAFAINIPSQNTAVGMLSLLKIQRLPVLAAYIPQAPSKSQGYFFCTRSKAAFATDISQWCFNTDWLVETLGYTTQRCITEISWGHCYDHKSTAHNGHWAYYTSPICII